VDREVIADDLAFITNLTRSSSPMSVSGSPATAMRSAWPLGDCACRGPRGQYYDIR